MGKNDDVFLAVFNSMPADDIMDACSKIAKTGTSAGFNSQTRALAESLVWIVQDMREYWPLTVRQAYYQAVSKRLINNTDAEYRRVSRILTSLRRDDALPWCSIEDRSRRTTDKRGVANVQEWAAEQLEEFMNWKYYHRCLVQKQAVYCEVATEKDALSSIIEEAVWPYCTRLNVVRGQVSSTMVNSIAERYDGAIQRGQKPIMLYMGDLDPSGVAIPKALKRNLLEHHYIDVEINRIALNPGQVGEYGLPMSLDAAKIKDPNYKSWISEYGKDQPTVELDALHPKDLSDIVVEALQRVYDIDEVSEQLEKEEEERALIKSIRVDVMEFIGKRYPDVFRGAGVREASH
jgi:hypothetical protein